MGALLYLNELGSQRPGEKLVDGFVDGDPASQDHWHRTANGQIETSFGAMMLPDDDFDPDDNYASAGHALSDDDITASYAAERYTLFLRTIYFPLAELGYLVPVVATLLGIGTLFYGGNFAVRRTALAAIGGFDTAIEFHGEDTNLGRRLVPLGNVSMTADCWLYTSARRYRAMGKRHVFRLYVRNFWSETIHHRPKDVVHEDVRL